MLSSIKVNKSSKLLVEKMCNFFVVNIYWHSFTQLVLRNQLGDTGKVPRQQSQLMENPLVELFVKQQKVLFRINIYQSPSDSNTDLITPIPNAQFNNLCVVKECFVSKMSIAQFNLLLKASEDTLNYTMSTRIRCIINLWRKMENANLFVSITNN